MKRRDFLKAAPVSATVPLLVAQGQPTEHIRVDEHPSSVLARYNQRFKGYQFAERLGQWSIFFTGFKDAQDWMMVCGQWLGWPGAWLSVEERKAIGRYFVASVPCDPGVQGKWEGEYRLGERFMLSGRLGYEDFANHDLIPMIDEIVADGRTRLIDAMKAAGVV